MSASEQAAKPAPLPSLSAEALLEAAERYRWDIDAPGEDGSTTWVVYDDKVSPFGKGIGCSRSLRKALTMAYVATVRRNEDAAHG